ncbi:hypothetical protein G3569_08930 [Aliifodinibius halophilus]|uniref:6-bladed beta-propeller n=1 Tax=Fodinibius halophilus TaxID=1736908 RepID=A0A6M1SX54_9BACT|nr:hypothetical protein [Fodinibius halophilus]
MGCEEDTEIKNGQNYQSFWQSLPQEVEKRSNKGILTVNDSLLLSERYDILDTSSLKINGDNLYIEDQAQQKIYAIDKHTLNQKASISISEGRGPRELTRLGSFDVASETVVISSINMQKIQIWNTDGSFRDEFRYKNLHPRRIRLNSNNNMVILSNFFFVDGERNLIQVINSDGNPVSGFGKVSKENYSSLKAEGHMLVDDQDNVYYAGYSEHIFKKWDPEGNLIFSVKSIDNYPSEANYAKMEGANQKISRYLEHAYFNAVGSTIYKNKWLIIHGGSNSKSNQSKIDIYNRNNGKYLFTVELPNKTGHIAADDQYLFVIHKIENEKYLFEYNIDF